MSQSVENVYNVSRSSAAKLLSVSVRTVDRYLKQGKISFVKTKGRTWLSKEDVRRLFDSELRTDPRRTDNFYTETQRDKMQDVRQDGPQFTQSEYRARQESSESVKSNPATNSIVSYQQKYLQAAEGLKLARRQTFKLSRYITYLQSKVSQMRPSQDFKSLELRMQSSSRDYSTHLKNLEYSYSAKLKKLNTSIQKKNQQIESEKLNRYALLMILIVLIAMQPVLWLLLR